EIAERDQVGAPRAPCPEAGTDRHAAARHRVTDRAAEVHAPATRLALAPRQPAAETRAQLADQLPGLLHVARGGFAEAEGAAPAPLLGAADERERLVEEAVEGGPIRLVLHQRRGERLAHRLALHADRGDGYQRIERFGDRHLDAAPRAERLHEVEDARAHPP